VFSQGPHRGGSRNDGGHHAHRDEHPAAFARRERVCWRSLAPVDRRRLLRPANSINSR
jgi:hypothetical protein